MIYYIEQGCDYFDWFNGSGSKGILRRGEVNALDSFDGAGRNVLLMYSVQQHEYLENIH